MKCLRCDTEMKQCKCTRSLGIYEPQKKPFPFSGTDEPPRNPKSVYVCDNCGYMEFSANEYKS